MNLCIKFFIIFIKLLTINFQFVSKYHEQKSKTNHLRNIWILYLFIVTINAIKFDVY